MIKYPFNRNLCITLPELNAKGRKFYRGELDNYIGEKVEVRAVWLADRQENDSITISIEETVSTLWSYYFDGELVIHEA